MFEINGAGRVLFGWGLVSSVVPEALKMGTSFYVVVGRDEHRAAVVTRELKDKGVPFYVCNIAGEPDTKVVSDAAIDARSRGCNVVISMGGGSVIDAGKAISALLTNPGDITDYLEVVGKGLTIENKPAPFIAVPTTSGTGSEVTKNAVLTDLKHKIKVSMRSPMMVPTLSVVDPELTVTLPANVTAWTGLDALTQLIEAFVCKRSNPWTDGICREGIISAARSLEKAVLEGDDRSAREDMSVASLFGGLALANAGLGAVHGFAGPMGGMFKISHGALCGSLLSHVMSANVRALKKTDGGSVSLEKYREIATMVTGDSNASVEDGISWVKAFCDRLKTPTLKELGIDSCDYPKIASFSMKASSMKGNPVPLSEDMLIQILNDAE